VSVEENQQEKSEGKSEELSLSISDTEESDGETKKRIDLQRDFYLKAGFLKKTTIERTCRDFANLDTGFATMYQVLRKSVEIRSTKE